jgi:hypothetical protein
MPHMLNLKRSDYASREEYKAEKRAIVKVIERIEKEAG